MQILPTRCIWCSCTGWPCLYAAEMLVTVFCINHSAVNISVLTDMMRHHTDYISDNRGSCFNLAVLLCICSMLWLSVHQLSMQTILTAASNLLIVLCFQRSWWNSSAVTLEATCCTDYEICCCYDSDLPQYGHKQWQSYFGRTFDVYTKLWKFQQQNRYVAMCTCEIISILCVVCNTTGCTVQVWSLCCGCSFI